MRTEPRGAGPESKGRACPARPPPRTEPGAPRPGPRLRRRGGDPGIGRRRRWRLARASRPQSLGFGGVPRGGGRAVRARGAGRARPPAARAQALPVRLRGPLPLGPSTRGGPAPGERAARRPTRALRLRGGVKAQPGTRPLSTSAPGPGVGRATLSGRRADSGGRGAALLPHSRTPAPRGRIQGAP